MLDKDSLKADFLQKLQVFAKTLKHHVSTHDDQWTIKGFIDVFNNIYTISSDTKIVSKILEIHLFSKFLEFANEHDFELVLAQEQNWYPDISFVSRKNHNIKFAVDLKTTYRNDLKPTVCNGFTLGSHGEYFINRNSSKNIQFPYNNYLGHYALGIIYSQAIIADLVETRVYPVSDVQSIQSVISDFDFFAQEKWRIASDKRGSGNTANIGSIKLIDDIVKGNGTFSKLGEEWFDEYWINYGKIHVDQKKIVDIILYLKFKGKDDEWIVNHVVKKRKGGVINED
jgi:Restriction endonuclease EcoRV